MEALYVDFKQSGLLMGSRRGVNSGVLLKILQDGREGVPTPENVFYVVKEGLWSKYNGVSNEWKGIKTCGSYYFPSECMVMI